MDESMGGFMGKKKMLLIDDDKDDCLMIKEFFDKSGYPDLMFVESGEEGLKKAEKELPDLVIIDTRLPGMDGFEVCRRIRETGSLKNTKIIVMTGFIDAIDAVKAREVGADDYCVKTSDCLPLIKAVKSVLS
ncbi:MAG: hypothetical protein COT17_04860 [Elusimicrobia bacterium CG08_land_8_20_14_0_20_51_18]|nr:MAG: hypothetical protein COT17_04860 [Elusimicrobia bacterium CG08_land_8_20_14_0_20_51_18]